MTMKRVTYCALCDQPFRYIEVNGKREYELWSRWEDPDTIYCSEECCYTTVAGRAQELKDEGKLQ
jgi:hypothetical protein